jgi:hypothetical protein
MVCLSLLKVQNSCVQCSCVECKTERCSSVKQGNKFGMMKEGESSGACFDVNIKGREDSLSLPNTIGVIPTNDAEKVVMPSEGVIEQRRSRREIDIDFIVRSLQEESEAEDSVKLLSDREVKYPVLTMDTSNSMSQTEEDIDKEIMKFRRELRPLERYEYDSGEEDCMCQGCPYCSKDTLHYRVNGPDLITRVLDTEAYDNLHPQVKSHLDFIIRHQMNYRIAMRFIAHVRRMSGALIARELKEAYWEVSRRGGMSIIEDMHEEIHSQFETIYDPETSPWIYKDMEYYSDSSAEWREAGFNYDGDDMPDLEVDLNGYVPQSKPMPLDELGRIAMKATEETKEHVYKRVSKVIDECRCVKHCASLYIDFVNLLANKGKALDISRFKVKYRAVESLSCDCDCRRYVLYLIKREDVVKEQGAKEYVAGLLFGNSTSVSDVVDDKIDKVGKVLTECASNIQHGISEDAKAYIDAKIESLKDHKPQVSLSLPDTTGLGAMFSNMISAENMPYAMATTFCILFLSRKILPSIGEICALFAGLAICYLGSDILMPILIGWLSPTPQSAGEWIGVVSEIIGISMFASKGKWTLDLSQILKNFTDIEREKPLLEQLLERMQNLVFTLIRLIAEACGKEFNTDFTPIAERIRALRKRIKLINTDPCKFKTPTMEFVDEVFFLQEEILSVYEDVKVSKGQERYVTQVKDMIQMMGPLVKFLEINKYMASSRYCPMLSVVVGVSGLGKTACQEPVNNAFCEEFCTEAAKARMGDNYKAKVMGVRCNQKFFEHATGQPIMEVNDLLQKKEVQNADFSMCEMIVQVCGNQPYELNCAEASRKGKVWAKFLAVNCSTNCYKFDLNKMTTLNDAKPFLRRVRDGFPVIMAVKQPYAMASDWPEEDVIPEAPEGRPADYFSWTVDWSKVPVNEDGTYNTDMIYTYYDWDFRRGQLKQGYRAYHSVTAYKEEYMRRHRLHYAKQISYLRSLAKNAAVDMEGLRADYVNQGKTLFDVCDKTEEEAIFRRSFEKLVKGEDSGDDSCSVTSEEEFRIMEKNTPVLSDYVVEDKNGDPVLNHVGEYIPYYNEKFRRTVIEDLNKYYLEKNGYKLDKEAMRVHDAMCSRLIEVDDDLTSEEEISTSPLETSDKSEAIKELDLKQRRMFAFWSYSQMRVFVRTKFTDPMMYAVRRIMQSGSTFYKACSLVATCMLDVVANKIKFFFDNPLEWFKDHPFVSMALGAIASLVIYKSITFIIRAFGAYSKPVQQVVKVFDACKKCDTDCKLVPELNSKGEPTGLYYIMHNAGKEGVVKTEPSIKVKEVELNGYIKQSKDEKAEERKRNYVNALMGNFYRFFYRIKLKGREPVINDPVDALALEGHLFELHYHVYKDLVNYAKNPEVETVHVGLVPLVAFSKGSKPVVWIPWHNMHFITRPNTVELDKIWFQMHSSFKKHTSAVKRMPVRDPEFMKLLESNRHHVKFMRKYAQREDSWSHVEDAKIEFHHFKYTPQAGMLGVINGEEQDPVDYDGYAIDIVTEEGDCGAPCFWWGDEATHLVKKHPVFQHPFLVYKHSAWYNNQSYGFGSAYFQDDYHWISKYTLSNIKMEDMVTTLERAVERAVSIANKVTCQSKEVIPLIHTTQVDAPLSQHHLPVGCVEPQTVNRKNNITKSDMYKDIKDRYGISKMPTKLTPGVEGDPLINGIQKYGGNQEVLMDFDIVDKISDFVVADIINKSSPITPEMQQRIPIKTCIQGGDGLRGLNRKSDIGVILRQMCKSMGWDPNEFKNCFGTEGPYDFDNPYAKTFVEISESIQQECEEGVKLPLLMKNALKVECKTEGCRLFHGTNKETLPVMMSNYGELIKWLTENRIKNGMLVGVNPAKDWPVVSKHLISKGEYGIPGDFGWFDKYQLLVLIVVFYKLAVAFYGDTDPAGNIAREATFEAIKDPTFLLALGDKSCIYQWQHGNSSGNALTTWINCLANIFIIYYIIFHILRDKEDFRKFTDYQLLEYIRDNISFVVMGDDHIIMLSTELRRKEYVTFYTYKEHIERLLHMRYTDDRKGKRVGFVIPNWTHISECTILGRGISVVNGRVVADLRDESLFEPLAWNKGKVKTRMVQLENVERALAELSAKGRKRYSLEMPFLVKSCYTRVGMHPRKNLTFESAYQSYLSLEFPEWSMYTEEDYTQESESDLAIRGPDVWFDCSPVCK